EAVAASSADAGTAARTPQVQGGFHTFELTADVQSWVSGTRDNYGWAILPWPSGTDGWGMGASENTTEINRPRLRVFFTPSIIITSITRGPTSAQIKFSGPAGELCSVLRSSTVNGTYSSIGTALIQLDGTASFTDNGPLPSSAAYYRISFP